MRKSRTRIQELLRENGFPLGLSLLLGQIAMRLRSWFIGRALRTRRARIGAGPQIRGARYMAIGDGFACGSGLWLEAVSRYQDDRHQPRISIGRNVSCSKDVHISCIQEITIGHDVLIGSGVYIGDHNHGRYHGQGASSPAVPPAMRPLWGSGPLIIEDRVFIGDKVTIVGELRIGHGTVVAANSVVTGSLPPMCIAAGIPARVIRMYDTQSGSWSRPEAADVPPDAP